MIRFRPVLARQIGTMSAEEAAAAGLRPPAADGWGPEAAAEAAAAAAKAAAAEDDARITALAAEPDGPRAAVEAAYDELDARLLERVSSSRILSVSLCLSFSFSLCPLSLSPSLVVYTILHGCFYTIFYTHLYACFHSCRSGSLWRRPVRRSWSRWRR